MTEGLVGGGALQLVTVCLSAEGVGEISGPLDGPVALAPAVLSHLRPSEARELAFCLLELAEHAERRSDSRR